MSNSTKSRQINILNSLFLIGTPLLSLGLVAYHLYSEGFIWWVWSLFLIFYILTGMSITAGYHRLFSHRAYSTNSLMKALYLIFGAAAFQNSALKWSSDHRIHHKDVDQEEDPYNINKGFFWAHMGWVMVDGHNNPLSNVNDLKADKLVMWQERNYFLLAILAGLALPTLIGYFLGSALGGLAVAGLFRVVFVHHSTFFINSLCHMWGSQPYSDEHTARDSAIVAFLTYGEGYHNFHHQFQTDYRNGIKWYHFDPTKWLIRSLASIGWASKLKVTSEDKILKAKLEMDLKRKQATENKALELLQETVLNAHKKWLVLKQDYQKLTESASLQIKSEKDRLRKQIEQAKLEWLDLKRRWDFELAKLQAEMA